MAQLKKFNDGRARWLICGGCRTLWNYPRTGCPYCEMRKIFICLIGRRCILICLRKKNLCINVEPLSWSDKKLFPRSISIARWLDAADVELNQDERTHRFNGEISLGLHKISMHALPSLVCIRVCPSKVSTMAAKKLTFSCKRWFGGHWICVVTKKEIDAVIREVGK